jgi:hypothetical protein
VTSVSTTQTPQQSESGQQTSAPVSKPPSLSAGALAVGIFMILVFVGVVGLIAASFFDAVPTITWPDFLVSSTTTVEKLGLMALVV